MAMHKFYNKDQRADINKGENVWKKNEEMYATVRLSTEWQIIGMKSDSSPWSSCHIK